MGTAASALSISDLHLGCEKSYFHSKNEEYQENKQVLIEFFSQYQDIDELILNGDFLELSLAGLDLVYGDVKAFFEIIANSLKPKRIVFIPGNHDHHYWRELVEQVYVRDRINNCDFPPGSKMFPTVFVDKRFSSADPNYAAKIFLTALWPGKKKVEFIIKYPHHLVKIKKLPADKCYYLFTHGHFLEQLFRPVNLLVKPSRIDELEAFNNIWLEAFDYHLGHSGDLSERVFKLLKSYEQGGPSAEKDVRKILNEIYLNLKTSLKLCDLKSLILKYVMKLGVKKIPTEKKSGMYQKPLDDALLTEIEKYIQNYIINRYKKENYEEMNLPSKKSVPLPFTFVFGHTHRPLKTEEDINKAKVYINNEIVIPVLNTGGWLRNDGPKECGENAGGLILDDNGARWETLEDKLK